MRPPGLPNDLRASVSRNADGLLDVVEDATGSCRNALMLLLDAGGGGFRGGISASKCAGITGTSKTTATRDLAELEKAGLLVATGQDRGTRYRVNVSG